MKFLNGAQGCFVKASDFWITENSNVGVRFIIIIIMVIIIIFYFFTMQANVLQLQEDSSLAAGKSRQAVFPWKL